LQSRDDLIHLRFRQRPKPRTFHHNPSTSENPAFRRNRFRRQDIIARDHPDKDACLATIFHGFRDSRSKRIHDAYNADKYHLLENIVEFRLRFIVRGESGTPRWPMLKVPVHKRNRPK
jgi:hypothetical protein